MVSDQYHKLYVVTSLIHSQFRCLDALKTIHTFPCNDLDHLHLGCVTFVAYTHDTFLPFLLSVDWGNPSSMTLKQVDFCGLEVAFTNIISIILFRYQVRWKKWWKYRIWTTWRFSGWWMPHLKFKVPIAYPRCYYALLTC